MAKPGNHSHKHGTDILHLSIRANLSNQGVISNATGFVSLTENQQGNSHHQELDLFVKHLDTSSTYQLLAQVNDDTNLTSVGTFDTDDNGNAALHYRDFGHGNGMGHGRLALPAALNPLSTVHGLSINDGSNQPVLIADLTSPNKLQYLIKRDLSTDTVDATLRIKAMTSQTQFRLNASGLMPTNDYLLVLNGSVVQTETSDSKGSLAIKSLVANPVEILDLTSVALWDSSSNVVLSTTLP